MFKRFSDRMDIDLEAEITLNNESYAGKIENVSEEGCFLRTFPEHGFMDFHPGMIFELKPELPSGKAVSLDCRVVWLEKDASESVTNSAGLQFLESAPEFDEYVKTLFTSHMGIM